MYNPQVSVYHVGGGTLPNNTPRKLFFNYRNSLYLLFKNLPHKQLFPVLLLRMILDVASSGVYLIRCQPRFAWAVIHAHLVLLLICLIS
ncbi:MAG: hypothetical protein HC906_02715 [Bacteroidales bacterium]|nr:hypothetical protein [Bacteroidales bacterium]